MAVVLPETEAQVAAILKICHRMDVPVVARGAGTGLSGGATPHHAGIVLSLAKFNQMKVDPGSCTAIVQCGVRNLAISEAAAPYGLYYAPDPSSQIACTIGGNVAENSGGVHCLKYGLTLHNVLRVRGFMVDGEAVEFGSQALDAPGLDLLSIVIGSEGMLAVTIEVTVKLIPKPLLARCIMASFRDIESAGAAVASVIAHGIIPAGLEMMDKAMTAAVDAFVHADYDLEAAAILLCESDGTPEEVEEEISRMEAVLNAAGASRIEVSRDEAQRLKFWSGRKNAFPASGGISPDYMCMDSTIPRKRLAEMLRAIQQMEIKYGLRCVNVFHAGDGNLHPLILFDAEDADGDAPLRAIRGRYPRNQRAPWRHGHRRAWRGRGEAQFDVRAILGSRARAIHGCKARLRCARTAQSRQSDSDAASLRGIRKDACAPRRIAVSRAAEILMVAADPALARLIDQVAAARARATPLEICGGGTKRFYGESPCGTPLEVTPLSGISSYEPTELVVTARAGTPLRDLEAALEERGQCLPFEPPRFAPGGTVGGMVAAGLSGPARASVGSVRDHVLGVTLLNGRAEMLTFGGQVTKNVAGYDVSRLIVGSLGILGVICDVSLKVLPTSVADGNLEFRMERVPRARSLDSVGRPTVAHQCQRVARRLAADTSCRRARRGRCGLRAPGRGAAGTLGRGCLVGERARSERAVFFARRERLGAQERRCGGCRSRP